MHTVRRAATVTLASAGTLALLTGTAAAHSCTNESRKGRAGQACALLIAGGWAAKGNVPSAVFNGLWFTGLGVAWWREGRKRASRGQGS